MLKDIIKELRILLESLCGKKTIKSWLSSISDSADVIIVKTENKDNVSFVKGELALENQSDKVNGRISLFFADDKNQISCCETSREFDKKNFVYGEIEKLFSKSNEIKYPIEHPNRR